MWFALAAVTGALGPHPSSRQLPTPTRNRDSKMALGLFAVFCAFGCLDSSKRFSRRSLAVRVGIVAGVLCQSALLTARAAQLDASKALEPP